MSRTSATRSGYFISLAEAIDLLAADLYGRSNPDRVMVVRKVKAGFTRRQLTSTSREFVLSTMLHLMQSALAALVHKGQVDIDRLSPEVRALIQGRGDRCQVERYLRNAKPMA